MSKRMRHVSGKVVFWQGPGQYVWQASQPGRYAVPVWGYHLVVQPTRWPSIYIGPGEVS
jgi:hypothetical protein